MYTADTLSKKPALCLALLACAVLLACAAAIPHHALAATDDHEGTWVTKSKCMYYKNADGKKVKGLTEIDGKAYYFDKKGVQRTGWRKISGVYRYFYIKNGKKGYMAKKTVVNGVKIDKYGAAVDNKTATKELKLMVAAQKRCDKITKPKNSVNTKLEKCFRYIWKDCRERGSYAFSSEKGWHRKFAWDIFDTKSGSCDSLAIGFVYLANAAGAKKCWVVSSGGHTWGEINGEVYDPEMAKQTGSWRYFAFPYSASGSGGSPGYARARTYYVKITRTKVWSKAKASVSKAEKASRKNGWVTKSGKRYYYQFGKKLKKQWLVKKGKTYYLNKKGVAATASAKIDGTYYVFSKKGVLQVGTKTRRVEVMGKTYRVNKKGKAVKGWDSSKTHKYLKTGEMLTDACWSSDKLWIFSSKGVYDSAATKKLRALCKSGSDATELLKELGKPKKRKTADTCRPGYLGGSEVTYTYKNIVVRTYCGETGPEYLNYIEAR